MIALMLVTSVTRVIQGGDADGSFDFAQDRLGEPRVLRGGVLRIPTRLRRAHPCRKERGKNGAPECGGELDKGNVSGITLLSKEDDENGLNLLGFSNLSH
jgi:hypothetical protein